MKDRGKWMMAGHQASDRTETKSIIDQCGELFKLGDHTFRCVLKIGHKGPHRATVNPGLRRRDIEEERIEQSEEVTLP